MLCLKQRYNIARPAIWSRHAWCFHSDMFCMLGIPCGCTAYICCKNLQELPKQLNDSHVLCPYHTRQASLCHNGMSCSTQPAVQCACLLNVPSLLNTLGTLQLSSSKHAAFVGTVQRRSCMLDPEASPRHASWRELTARPCWR